MRNIRVRYRPEPNPGAKGLLPSNIEWHARSTEPTLPNVNNPPVYVS